MYQLNSHSIEFKLSEGDSNCRNLAQKDSSIDNNNIIDNK